MFLQDTPSYRPPPPLSFAAAVFNIHSAGASLLHRLHKSSLPGAADPGSVTAATCITCCTPAATVITDLHYVTQHLLLELLQSLLLSLRPSVSQSLLVLIHIVFFQLVLPFAVLLALCPSHLNVFFFCFWQITPGSLSRCEDLRRL